MQARVHPLWTVAAGIAGVALTLWALPRGLASFAKNREQARIVDDDRPFAQLDPRLAGSFLSAPRGAPPDDPLVAEIEAFDAEQVARSVASWNAGIERTTATTHAIDPIVSATSRFMLVITTSGVGFVVLPSGETRPVHIRGHPELLVDLRSGAVLRVDNAMWPSPTTGSPQPPP